MSKPMPIRKRRLHRFSWRLIVARGVFPCLLAVLLCGVLACSGVRPQYGLSDKVYTYIVRESHGGRLDYRKSLQENLDYKHKGVSWSREHMAMLMWAKAVKRMGLKNLDNAVLLYQDIYNIEVDEAGRAALSAGLQ